MDLTAIIILSQKSWQKNLKNILLEKYIFYTEKCINFTGTTEKEVTGIDKMEKKFKNIYLTYYNLLIAPGLWQAHYQILSIIFLKEFIKLNVSTHPIIKNVKLEELNINIPAVCF